MKIIGKLFITTILSLAALAVTQPSASALTMQLKIDYGSRHSGVGGEFNISSADFNPVAMGYTANTIVNSGFETFCVEKNEYFNPGSTYYYSISDGAINGGISGGNPDPLSIGSAWLYSQFAHGTLAGYDYSTLGGSSTSAASLQEAFWWLEGEVSGQNFANSFETAVVGQFGSATNAMANNNGSYGVAVVNIWGDARHTQLAQDQLVLAPVPDGGTTALLLGMGLVGLCLFVRKCSANA
jgi:hypothetical protein